MPVLRILPDASIPPRSHPTKYAGIPDRDELVGTDFCTSTITIAYCVAADGVVNESDIPSCAVDPRKTAANNLLFAEQPASPPPRVHILLGRTPASIKLNVFYCSTNTQFNLGQMSELDSTECVPKA